MYFSIFNIFKKYKNVLGNCIWFEEPKSNKIIDCGDDVENLNDAPYSDSEKKILTIFLGKPIVKKDLRKWLVISIIISFILSLIVTYVLVQHFNFKPYMFLFIYTIIIFIFLSIFFSGKKGCSKYYWL